MSNWNEKYTWAFPLAGTSEDQGFNHPGIDMFASMPYVGVTKEIIQNVLDARDKTLPQEVPVKVAFEAMEIDVDDIPGAEQLTDVIDRCCEYYKSGTDYEGLSRVKEYADANLKGHGKISVLKISDYNTTGLTGISDPDNHETAWYGLVKSFSSSHKGDDASGSKGVGKFATYNFSRIRTVFYSTLTKDEGRAFQGKTLLTTFRSGDDGKKRMSRARFGYEREEEVDPVTNEIEIPSVYHRDDIGTDIYAVGFEKEDGWYNQVLISVIEYFFYAIYKGNLEVTITDGSEKIEINKSNIAEMIDRASALYGEMTLKEELSFTASMYWKAISSTPITRTFSYYGHSMGNYDLYLYMGDDVNERRVLEMRKAGMRIREDRFQIPANFVGVFVATGEGAVSDKPQDNISSFLRKCENPSHDAWAGANYRGNEEKAKRIIKKLHGDILKDIKSVLPEDDGEQIKAFGVNELLMSQGEDGPDGEKEEAFMTAKPKEVNLEKTGTKAVAKKDLSKPTNGRGKGKRGEKKEDDPDKKKKKRDNKQGNKKITPIELRRVRTPFDEDTGIYRISLVPEKDAKILYLEITARGDDGNADIADIASAISGGNDLEMKKDMILVKNAKAGEKVSVKVLLRGKRRERLEVFGYAGQ